MNILKYFIPLLFPAGFWAGIWLERKRNQRGELHARTQELQAAIEKTRDYLKERLTPPAGFVRGPTLMFDHPPTEDEIQAEINKFIKAQGVNGQITGMPKDRNQAINADFEASEIFQSLKNLDNENRS